MNLNIKMIIGWLGIWALIGNIMACACLIGENPRYEWKAVLFFIGAGIIIGLFRIFGNWVNTGLKKK